jgi:hypothetical protein
MSSKAETGSGGEAERESQLRNVQADPVVPPLICLW